MVRPFLENSVPFSVGYCTLLDLPTPFLLFRYCYMNPDEENAVCEAPEEVNRIQLLLCRRIVWSNLWHVAVPAPDSAMQFL